MFEVASSDLVHMGLSVVSYTIKDISDDVGYLAALGMTRTAQVLLLFLLHLLSLSAFHSIPNRFIRTFSYSHLVIFYSSPSRTWL